MIRITDKPNCCGCSACASICPKHCITMQGDNEGFLYPIVKESDCIDCGLCEKVCNVLHPFMSGQPLKVLAAINKDEKVRLKSSSGGIFHILAEQTIKEGGVVFGARFDDCWQVVIDYAEDMKEVEAFMGSKYVQARVENAYSDVKRFLIAGRKVLFSGTPCQVAGLHKFLRKPYDNLLTVDFICHGTPSPKVWGMYLDEVIRKGQRICSVEFRNKEKGWKNFSFNLRYNEADKTVSMLSSFKQNHYMKAFLSHIILRPSCHACKAKGCSSQSDITIADFWGVNTIFPDMDDDKGISIVFINKDKAQSSLNSIHLEVHETTYNHVKHLNTTYYRSVSPHPKREEFFTRLGSENLTELINDYTKPTFKQRLKANISRGKALVKTVFRLIGGGKTESIKQTATKAADIYLIPKNPKIVSVSFRNKDAGWKGYNMEIRLKEQICE